MQNTKIKILHEDENILVIDKPAGISVYSENPHEITIIENLIRHYPDLQGAGSYPRYGIVHRLDKETSGILTIARNNQTLTWIQKQFKESLAEKKYIALVVGVMEIEKGEIKTLIGRSKKDFRKQKIFLPHEPEAEGKREAITEYKILKKYSAKGGSASGGKNYTLVEAIPKTGRTHQIRAHFAYIHHSVAGDKKYGSKNQIIPEGLQRHFLHANYLKIKLPDNQIMEFQSELPEDLKIVLNKLD